MRARRVLVVGGGPAGLAAALAAARAGHDVTLCEAGAYPRDKVCGEFLSLEIGDDFAALGWPDWTQDTKPVELARVLVTSPRGAALELPDGARGWALTRRALEHALAKRAIAAGVRLLERASIQKLEPRSGAWSWRTRIEEGCADIAICAFGKRSALDASVALPRADRPEPYGAVKAYFDAPRDALEADVELHLIRGGYVGLNPVEGGRLALCALLEREATTEWARLRARFAANAALAERLDRLGPPARPVRGLAAFGFGAQGLGVCDKGAIALFCGDAARMMPSFSGDGIAVALRSGRMAAEALAGPDPLASYGEAYRREFASRMRVANALHGVFFRPILFDALAPVVARWPAALDRLYRLTRGVPRYPG